jgi:hypothetical protein
VAGAGVPPAAVGCALRLEVAADPMHAPAARTTVNQPTFRIEALADLMFVFMVRV